MKSFVHHPVDLSVDQLRKLRSGGAITLKPAQFSDDSKTAISVLPQTARRIRTAMRKRKGIRVALKPEEDVVDIETGGSLKSFGKAITRGAKSVGRAFTSDAAMKTYNKLGHYGLDVGIPVLAGVAGEMLGGPAGAAAGEAFGSVAADQIANRTGFKGKGFFKGIKKLTGINKTDIIKTAKRIGKEVVSNSAALAGEAITAYTGNPVLGASTKHAIEKGGHKAIDSGNVRRGLRAAGGTAKQMAKDFAIEAADSYINTHLSGDEKKYAEKALAGEYPSAKDLIYDYGKTKAEKFEQQFYQPVGGGRLVHVHKYGMGSPYVSMPYKKAMRPLVGGGSLAGLGVSEIKPMTDLMTLSPVASMYSPQMNPFVLDKSPQLSTKTGGSFLPSGRYGGSFEPSGGY